MSRLTQDNCLAATHPKIAKEWDQEKNDLSPWDVTYGSGISIWWKCKLGHSWKVRCSTRTNMSSGCPVCSGRCASSDNNLATKRPDLVAEWSRKNPMPPTTVKPYSKSKVWWQCEQGHEWQSTVFARSNNKAGCPQCRSLQVCHPRVASEWHPTLNGSLTPSGVMSRSNKRAWWQCKRNSAHIWDAVISSRTRPDSGDGCPFCSHQRMGNNSLQESNPALLAEWHPLKNLPVLPTEVCGGKTKFWWVCRKGHEWQASLDHRFRGRGCPVCAHHKVVLSDGERCDSHVEAYAYLKFKEQGVKFLHDRPYGSGMGRKRYDFFFPSLKKYVEVTSYNEDWKHWNRYIARIEQKRVFATKQGCTFELLRIIMTPEKFHFVRRHLSG